MKLRTKLLIDYYVGGMMHALFKPLVLLLGRALRREHDLRGESGDVTVVKLLGGGSLVIAYPSLLAMKRSGRVKTLRALVFAGAKPFAELLGIFDEIIVIRDAGLLHLIADSIAAWWRLLRTDTIVDLEIHSRLSTLFCLFTCARNRIAFYTANSFWRRGISTHLLFCNQSTGIYFSYDQVAQLFGAPEIEFGDASQTFRAVLERQSTATLSTSPVVRDGGAQIAIAPCCSDLGKERMMLAEEWLNVVMRRDTMRTGAAHLHLLGGKADVAYLEDLRGLLIAKNSRLTVHNHAGKLNLTQSVSLLREIEELLCVDSSMLHFARLLGVNTTSYWGPTDPATRLRESSLSRDVVHYFRLPCSPCVHITDVAPCKGNNICMRLAVNPNASVSHNPLWLEDFPGTKV